MGGFDGFKVGDALGVALGCMDGAADGNCEGEEDGSIEGVSVNLVLITVSSTSDKSMALDPTTRIEKMTFSSIVLVFIDHNIPSFASCELFLSFFLSFRRSFFNM